MLPSPFRVIATVSYDDSDSSGSAQQRKEPNCLVGTCMNCSYSFRLGLSGSTDFCSKGMVSYQHLDSIFEPFLLTVLPLLKFAVIDCQTCYILYSVNPEHSPRKKESITLKTNKQRIYDFQKKLDTEHESRSVVRRENSKEHMVSADELPSSKDKQHPIQIPLESEKQKTGKEKKKKIRFS